MLEGAVAKAWAAVTGRDSESGCLCQSLAAARTSLQPLNLLGFFFSALFGFFSILLLLLLHRGWNQPLDVSLSLSE